MPSSTRARWQAALAAALLTSLLCLHPLPSAQPPKGEQILVDCHGDPLPPGVIARCGTVRFRHGTEVSSLAASPDGKFVVSVGRGHGCVWDISSGKPVPLFSEAVDCFGCAFSADGKVLIVEEGHRVSLWDVRSGRRLATLREHYPWAWDFALSPDGKMLAFADANQDGAPSVTVKLRDVATGKVIRSFGDHPSRMGRVAFTPDGRSLVTANLNAASWGDPEKPCWVKRWDVMTGKLQAQLAIRGVHIAEVVIARDGKTIAFAPYTGDSAPQVWDAQTGRRLPAPVSPTYAKSLALTPDGKKLAAHDGKRIQVWDTTTGRLLSRVQTEESEQSSPLALAFTPDGKALISAGRRGVLRRWNVSTGKEIGPLHEPSEVFYQLAFSPDSKLVASGGEGAIFLWQARSGREVRRLPGGISRPSLTFTRDGNTLITDDGILWDVRTGREVARLRPPEPEGYCSLVYPTLSPDGKVLACLLPGTEIGLFDVTARKELRRFGKQFRPRGPLAFSPDGKLLASSKWSPNGVFDPENSTLLLWEVATGRLCREGSGPGNPLHSPTFSPDGKRVFGRVNWQLSMWEVKSRGLRTRLYPESVEDMALLPDGTTLALALSLKDVVLLWDLRTSEALATLRGHRGQVHRVAVSPDGHLLATSGNDGAVLVWDVRKLLGPRR
jgi:WD40 repeat protein